MKPWVRSLSRLLGVFLEGRCTICQRPATDQLCQDCQRQIHACQCSQPQQFWHPPHPIFAWGYYGGSLRRAIAALKFEDQPDMANLLGYWMAKSWLESPPIQGRAAQSLTVVPVPMHPDKQRERGFNQAELLAKAFCRETQLPLNRQLLQRVRATAPQFSLSPAERQQNLVDAFALNPKQLRSPSQARILLLDDIYTTGATVQAAINVFQHHHISVVGTIVLAKAINNSG